MWDKSAAHQNTSHSHLGTDTARISIDRTLKGIQESSNFVSGTAGCQINWVSGDVEFNDGYFRGDISAATGTFTGGIAIGTSPNWFRVDSEGNIWSGRATLAGAKTNTFAVTKEGVLTATDATITGTITATSGAIGGWDIVSGYIYNLQSGTPTSNPSDGLVMASGNEAVIVYENTEKRVEIGYLSAGVYGIRVYADDGTTIIFEASDSQSVIGGGIIGSGSEISFQGWTHDMVFSVTDADTVAWASGTITLMNGDTFAIDAGNTGDMTAETFIYLDTGTSETVLQTSTPRAIAVGLGKIMIAIAKNATNEAEFIVFGSSEQNIDGGKIRQESINAYEIASNAIEEAKIAADAVTAAKIAVSGLDGATGNVSADHIIANMIQSNAITTVKINADAVTAPKINVVGLDGASGRIVVADQADADEVTGGINTHAVTLISAGKILISGAAVLSDWSHATDATLIDGGEIYTGSVTATQIAANTITANEIFANTITSSEITTGEFITLTAQIKNAIITNAKIDSLAVSKLTAGTITSKAITLAVAAGTGDVYFNAGKTDFTNTDRGLILGIDDVHATLGDGTSQWDITNPAGTTFRYTWDGTGTDPDVDGNVIVGDTVKTSGFANAGNDGIFITTAVSTDYFEVTNASGVAEVNATSVTIDVGGRAKFYIGDSSAYFNWTGTAMNIYGATVTASTVQTATSGQRIVLGTDHILTTYDSSDNVNVRIQGTGITALFANYTGNQLALSVDNANVATTSTLAYFHTTGSASTGKTIWIRQAGSGYALDIDTVTGASKTTAVVRISTVNTEGAPLNLGIGTPSSPSSGDIWYNGDFLTYRTSSTTRVLVQTQVDQTIDGEITFGVFPITPSSAPDADYEVANKKYVDDNVSTPLIIIAGNIGSPLLVGNNFFKPFGSDISATEARCQFYIPYSGTLKNLRVYSGGAENELTYYIRINGSNTALAVSHTATVRWLYDTADTVNVSAGDLLSFFTNIPSPANDYPQFWQVELE